jgi:hypothetical protein
MSGVFGFCHANAGICTRPGFYVSTQVAKLRADVRVDAGEQKDTHGVFSHRPIQGVTAGLSRLYCRTERSETGGGLRSMEMVNAPGGRVPRRVKVDTKGSCHYSAAPSGDLCSALKRFFQLIGWENRRSVRTAGDTSARSRLAGEGVGSAQSSSGGSGARVNANFAGARRTPRGLTAHEGQLVRMRFCE